MSALSNLRETLYIRLFGLLKIPLVAHMRPVVEEMTEERCVIRFPLGRRTRNHLGAMYFGALCIGADCAGGAIAMRRIQASREPVQFVFKDFSARFLKRAEGDVLFTCEDGALIRALVDRAAASGKREEATVKVVATVPEKLGAEPVALFELTISLKRKPG